MIKELVAQLLAHDGYVETAKAFANETRSESKALTMTPTKQSDSIGIEEDLDAVNRQREYQLITHQPSTGANICLEIRAAILDGDIDKAIKRTNAYYPHVLRENPQINFRLRCRKFVEMMRHCAELMYGSTEKDTKGTNGHTEDVFEHAMELDDPTNNGDDWDKMDTEEGDNMLKYHSALEEAFKYGQEINLEHKDDRSIETQEGLKDTFALFAYDDPRHSRTAHLLHPSGRALVAEELNSAILGTCQFPIRQC